ncbi:MAG: four helix bundle protein [Arcobacteraceae bacterium]|jgi:four helix bundle protein|nr:four helix bundle protein [Arcobacteraceae bacterium]
MGDNILYDKSYKFAIRVVNLNKYLQLEHREFILSKQLLRSGTSIGAMTREAKFAQSRADFVNKLSIALKEANETDYWLDLLHDTNYINNKMFNDIKKDIQELISLLVSIVKTTKDNS